MRTGKEIEKDIKLVSKEHESVSAAYYKRIRALEEELNAAQRSLWPEKVSFPVLVLDTGLDVPQYAILVDADWNRSRCPKSLDLNTRHNFSLVFEDGQVIRRGDFYKEFANRYKFIKELGSHWDNMFSAAKKAATRRTTRPE